MRGEVEDHMGETRSLTSRLMRLAAAAAICTGLGTLAVEPAFAGDDHRRHWRHHHRHHYQHHRQPRVYFNYGPPVYYAPPPVVYYPRPTYVYPAPVYPAPSLGLVFNFR